jgi:uncharacterized delta-60 repeat protein
MVRAVDRGLRGAGACLVLILAVASAPPALAAGRPGTLDRSFGKAGRVSLDVGSHDAYAYAVAHEGPKIVVAGTHEFRTTADILVARVDAKGRPDRTFSGDGRMTADAAGGYDQAGAVAVLPDGKILVAGTRSSGPSARFLVMRITANGRLDRTFGGGDGFVTTGFAGNASYGNALTVRSDGRFVVCGNGDSDALLARYRPDGALDRSFGIGGRVVAAFPGQIGSSCEGLTHQGHKTVMTGSATDGITQAAAVARFGPRGAPDASFSGDGYATVVVGAGAETDSVVALPTGGVVSSGYSYGSATSYDVMLVQLTAHGHPDPSFGGGDGVVTDDLGASEFGWALARQGDGRLIVAGNREGQMFVARYLRGGARDATFAGNGYQAKTWGHPSAADAVVVVGRKVVAAGWVETSRYRVAIERLFL